MKEIPYFKRYGPVLRVGVGGAEWGCFAGDLVVFCQSRLSNCENESFVCNQFYIGANQTSKSFCTLILPL